MVVLANVKVCGGAEITAAKKSDIFLPFFYHGILKCPDELKQLYVMMYAVLYFLNRERYGKITNCMVGREGSMHSGR
jgi:hypothetical protein